MLLVLDAIVHCSI